MIERENDSCIKIKEKKKERREEVSALLKVE